MAASLPAIALWAVCGPPEAAEGSRKRGFVRVVSDRGGGGWGTLADLAEGACVGPPPLSESAGRVGDGRAVVAGLIEGCWEGGPVFVMAGRLSSSRRDKSSSILIATNKTQLSSGDREQRKDEEKKREEKRRRYFQKIDHQNRSKEI